MTLRDMTPDELDLFEQEVVKGKDEPERRRDERAEDDPLQDVEPGDDDGLPDGPAKFRVPS